MAPGLSALDAERVAAAVGDLPLVVDQAGALLGDARLNVDTYLYELEQRADELLALAQDGGGTYPVSVTALWDVAFDRLAADDPAALDLLTFGPGVDRSRSRCRCLLSIPATFRAAWLRPWATRWRWRVAPASCVDAG